MSSIDMREKKQIQILIHTLVESIINVLNININTDIDKQFV